MRRAGLERPARFAEDWTACRSRVRAPAAAAAARPGDGGGRPALAACLLALVAVGLRGTVPPPALNGAYRHDGLLIAAAAEAVLACLLVALLIRHSRAPDDAVIAAQLRKLLTYIVVIGLIAIPVAYVFDVAAHVHLALRPLRPRHGAQRRALPSAAPRQPPRQRAHRDHLPLALVAAVAVYGLVRFIAAYRGTWTGWRGRAASAAIEPARRGRRRPSCREVVESGRSALRLLDDARAAIIACYVAMEQSPGPGRNGPGRRGHPRRAAGPGGRPGPDPDRTPRPG